MAQLPGTVRAADPGVLDFDTDGIVTAGAAADFVARGYRICIRYVSRVAREGADDLTGAEAQRILAAGLPLMVVQHPRQEGWTIGIGMGASDGVHAA